MHEAIGNFFSGRDKLGEKQSFPSSRLVAWKRLKSTTLSKAVEGERVDLYPFPKDENVKLRANGFAHWMKKPNTSTTPLFL